MGDLGLVDLVTALGLVLVIEGLLLAVIPDALRRIVLAVASQPPDALRIGGLVSAAIGVAIVWLVRG